MRFAFVADDFTGATDALWQFRRHGLTGRLVTDIAFAAEADVDVIGVATTARASADPVSHVLPAVRALAELGASVIQYKVCSTFDSTPQVGSIGAVIAAVRGAGLAAGAVPVLAAQPEFGRYTCFGNHFVRHGDEVRRLDRHPPMRDHPIHPATEADLRVRLEEQGAGPVGRLPAGVTAETYRDLRTGPYTAFVADASTDEHLRALGTLLLADAMARHPLFCVGSGGIGHALGMACADLGQAGGTGGTPPVPLAPAAPVLVVSGSRSPITAGQIAAAREAGWRVLDAFDSGVAEAATAHLAAGEHTVVQTTTGPARDPAEVGARLGAVAAAAVRAGLTRRVVVAGGDTSGEVVAALGARSLDVIALPSVGGPVCVLSADDPAFDGIEVALKGGQVGGPDYLLRAASGDARTA